MVAMEIASGIVYSNGAVSGGAVPLHGLVRWGRRPNTAHSTGTQCGDMVQLGRPGPLPRKVEIVGSTNVRDLYLCRDSDRHQPAVVISRDLLNRMTNSAQKIEEVSCTQRAREEAESAALRQEEKQRRRDRWRRCERTQSAPPKRDMEDEVQKRLQQREEVRNLQRQVLTVKCTAIREAQLQEKENIRRKEKEEDARLNAEVEVHRQMALQENLRRQKVAEKTRDVAARSLLIQMEAKKIQNQKEKHERQTEALLVRRRDARLKDELEEEQRRKREFSLKVAENIKKQTIEVKNRMKKEEAINAKEEQKAARVAEEKKRLADEMAVQQSRLKENKDVKQMLLVENCEKQQEYLALQQHLRQEKEIEQVEREWRQKMLREARRKKAREEEMFRERENQVKLRREMKKEERRREIELCKATSKSCIIPGKDLRPSIREKEEVGRELRLQAQMSHNRKMAEMQAAEEERKRLQELQDKEERAIRNLQSEAVTHLRQLGVPGHLVRELERQVMRDQPVIPPPPVSKLGPVI